MPGRKSRRILTEARPGDETLQPLQNGCSTDAPDAPDKSTMASVVDSSSLGRASCRAQPPAAGVYKVYPQRWFILVVVCLLAFSNATMWITYTSLSKATTRFYCGLQEENDSCRIGIWTNQIFQIMGMILGIMGMFVTDRYGIKSSVLAGTSLNAAGALVRALSSLPLFEFNHREGLLHCGSILAASAQPFFLVLSPKVAEFWFPEDQRALANALSFVANPFGVAAGSVLPALMINADIKLDSWDFFKLNAIFAMLASVVFVASLFIRHGSPPSPPSAAGDNHNAAPDFLPAIVCVFKTRQFWVVIFIFSLTFSLQWGFFLFVDDDFSSQMGYPKELPSYLMALSALVGCASSIAAGAFVDRTKKFKEVIIGCLAGYFITALSTNLFLRHTPALQGRESVILLVLCALLGCFAVPVFPIGIELGIETTFPVMEATSSGILVIFGQAAMFLVVETMMFARQLSSFIYTLDGSTGWPALKSNTWLALDLWNVYGGMTLLLAIFLLRPKYKRVAFERSIATKADSSAVESGVNESFRSASDPSLARTAHGAPRTFSMDDFSNTRDSRH